MLGSFDVMPLVRIKEPYMFYNRITSLDSYTKNTSVRKIVAKYKMRIDDRSKILFKLLIGKSMFSTNFLENKFVELNRSQSRNKFGKRLMQDECWYIFYTRRYPEPQGNTITKCVISFVQSITLQDLFQSNFIIITVIIFC